MNFKKFLNNPETNEKILNENIRISSKLINNNQIVKIPKIGWYVPYSCVFSPSQKHKKIYSLEEYRRGNLQDDNLIDKNISTIKEICENSTRRLGRLGFSRQTFDVLFINLENNREELLKHTPEDEIYQGVVVYENASTIAVEKEILMSDSEEAEDVLVHESAHAIWFNLNKETKQWFVQWYMENVVERTLKEAGIELSEKDIDAIWNSLEKTQKQNIRRLVSKEIPQIALRILIQKYGKGNIDEASVISPIKKSLEFAFRRNKGILRDENAFKTVMGKIKLGRRSEETIANVESDNLRDIAFEKGFVPSEYAATNPDELWAETVMFASKQSKISRSLKSALNKVISGMV